MGSPAVIIVVTDASVLINLAHVDLLRLLNELPPWKFILVPEVQAEITDPAQSETLEDAMNAGWLELHTLQDLKAIEAYAGLASQMGRGEAASLALAATAGYAIASDEKRRFRREAIRYLGEKNVLNTPIIMLKGVVEGILSVEDAEAARMTLAARQFWMDESTFTNAAARKKKL